MSFWQCWERQFRCKVLPEFNPVGVQSRVLTRHTISPMIINELIRLGITAFGIEEPKGQDMDYMVYPEKTIMEVRSMMPGFYNHREFLKDKFRVPADGSDCDNHAEHYSYWFHRLLPGCLVITLSVTPPPHRFVCVPTFEGGFTWHNGGIEGHNYTSVYDIVY